MPIVPRQLPTFVAVALLACSLSACGTINEKLAAGLGDYVPKWAGGLPPDAPPRPGTAKYEEFVRERERKRLEPAVVEPAVAKDNAGKSNAATNAVTLDPVH
jgi:hypothetical protein